MRVHRARLVARELDAIEETRDEGRELVREYLTR